MAKRRSPNYPAVGLRDAITDITVIHSKDGRNKISRDAVARHLGYNGLNGRSMRKIGALKAYGLMDGRGDDLRVSDDAVEIIAEPASSETRQKIISKCAFQPALFSQFQDHFEDSPSEENLKSYLIKNAFTDDGAKKVIAVYLDTLGLVSEEGNGYNSDVNGEENDLVLDADAITRFVDSLSGQDQKQDRKSDMNQFKVLVDGDQLQITGKNVDLAGIDSLKEMLDKYKDILGMTSPKKAQDGEPAK